MPYATKEAKAANAHKRGLRHYAVICEARDKPCVDCGIRLPGDVMQFDHVRGVKAFDVTTARSSSLGVIQAEIDKCDIRCPNCHALRHYYERVGRGL